MRRTLIALCFSLTLTIPLFAEEGLASFYAGKFQGRLTANGEIFDTRRFTAAHKTLAFNTIVKVTNLENGGSTLARINDRGPFIEGRIIDLSRAAASAIGMVAAGVAPVLVEIVAEGDGGTFHRIGYREVQKTIQVGAFGNRENAELLIKKLRESGFKAEIEPAQNGVVRVILPGVPVEDLLLTTKRLALIGHEDAFVRGEES